MGYSERALKEAKAIQKKAVRRGESPKGRDLVRLRRLEGSARKAAYQTEDSKDTY